MKFSTVVLGALVSIPRRPESRLITVKEARPPFWTVEATNA